MLAALMALHVGLALAMTRFTAVSTLHAWGTLLVGLIWASGGKPTVKLACLGSYIAGSEVLWRMTHAGVFWEFAKYALVIVFLLGARGQRPLRPTLFPLAYFGLLVPAVFLSVAAMDFGTLRQQVSFNLSGPLALAATANYFARLHVDRAQLKQILLSYLIPIVAIWVLVVSRIVSAERLVFTSESNANLSGGFGPNQTSSVLGCAAMIALLIGLFGTSANQRVHRFGWCLVALALGTQSALTFSRSGLYLAVAGVFAACAFAVRDSRRRTTLILTGVVLYVTVNVFVIPFLDRFTQGTLSQRFAQTQTSGRTELMKADFLLWQDNLVFGVGPGMARKLRTEYMSGHAFAAHSEITRMFSEHGLFGFAALSILCLSTASAVLRIRAHEIRSMIAGLVVFGILFLVSNAMRIVLCSYLVGICFGAFKRVSIPATRPVKFRRRASLAARSSRQPGLVAQKAMRITTAPSDTGRTN